MNNLALGRWEPGEMKKIGRVVLALSVSMLMLAFVSTDLPPYDPASPSAPEFRFLLPLHTFRLQIGAVMTLAGVVCLARAHGKWSHP
jgi:hypothetical protein